MPNPLHNNNKTAIQKCKTISLKASSTTSSWRKWWPTKLSVSKRSKGKKRQDAKRNQVSMSAMSSMTNRLGPSWGRWSRKDSIWLLIYLRSERRRKEQLASTDKSRKMSFLTMWLNWNIPWCISITKSLPDVRLWTNISRFYHSNSPTPSFCTLRHRRHLSLCKSCLFVPYPPCASLSTVWWRTKFWVLMDSAAMNSWLLN